MFSFNVFPTRASENSINYSYYFNSCFVFTGLLYIYVKIFYFTAKLKNITIRYNVNIRVIWQGTYIYSIWILTWKSKKSLRLVLSIDRNLKGTKYKIHISQQKFRTYNYNYYQIHVFSLVPLCEKSEVSDFPGEIIR